MTIRLKPFNEIIGTLTDVQFSKNEIKLYFSIIKEIELPVTALGEEKLKNLIGKKAGIIQLHNEYKIRKIRY